MGQEGNTGFIFETTNGVDLITDTYIDKNAARDDDNNFTDTLVPMKAAGSSDETAIIMQIDVPDRGDVLDSNGNVIPDDAIFSHLQLRLRVTTAPSSTVTLYGYRLKDDVNLEVVTGNHVDGTAAGTAWAPDFSNTVKGNTLYESLAFVSTHGTSTGNTDDLTLFFGRAQNDITWGSSFQLIIYATTTDIEFGLIDNTNDTNKPKFKVFFTKPTPDSPTIQVVPDAGGINGIIEITPSKDDAVVKHRIDYNIDGLTAQISTDFTDIGRTEILTTELTKDSGIAIYESDGSSEVGYNNVFPLSFDSGNSIDTTGNSTGDTPARTIFRLYAEDNYNTDTNGGASNEVTISRPAITLTDSATGAINIGDENTFTLTTSRDSTTGAGLGNYTGQFEQYAFHPSVDDIVYDTGITLGGSLTNAATDEFEIFSSDVPFEIGDLIKIDDEYMRVVGFQGSSNVVTFVRGALGSTKTIHSSSAPIFKVDDTKFIFTKLDNPTGLHTFNYKYPKAKSSHTAVAYVKDQDGWRSDPAHIAVNVSESNPIAKLSASRTKVPYAQYGDNAAGLTLSLSNSKAIGSDNEIINYLFSYKVGKGSNSSTEPQPIACANGLTNDNSCFDSGSKRVAIVNVGVNEDHSDAKFKIFGVASFQADNTSVTSDTSTGGTFSHYKYVSETITVNSTRLTETISTNFYKSIDCIVGVDISAHDTECTRYLLKVANADVETNDAALVNGSGLASDPTVTTVTVDSPEARHYTVGDFILLDGSTTSGSDEIAQIVAIPHATQLTVERGMLFSTAVTHADDTPVKVINHNMIINNDLRIAGNEDSTPDALSGEYWKWGGFARIVGDSSGDGIDFDTDETIELQTVLDANSTGTTSLDWYEHGFLEGDVIKVGNTTDNGTYAAPKYFKIIKIYNSGGDPAPASAKDTIKIANTTDLLTDDEALYITTSIGTQNTDTAADIVRYDNALNVARTVTLSSFNSSSDVYDGEADDFIFAGGVVDANITGTNPTLASAPSIYRDSFTETIVRGVTPRTLDLDSLVSSSDIAILNTSISRSNASNSGMPLGNRRYPITGFNTKLGDVTMSANIRILSQAGLRQIWSLVEGDRYDYAFLDSSQIDTPTTVYKSYRLQTISGTINKSPDNAAQYLASLKFVVVGEEIA
tara:strand:+ start:2139 stop:5600 length:3462 start_codon:yes stop_codon:yes gene_type:complete